MRLLLVGPLPPPVGGATLLFKQLASELGEREEISVYLVNTSRTSNDLVESLRQAFRAAVAVSRWIGRSDVVSFHSSRRGAALFGPVIAILCALHRKPWMFRGFGDFAGWHRRASAPMRILFDWTALRANIVLFETKESVRYFESRTTSLVSWYANNRPTCEAPTHDALRATDYARFAFVGHVKPSKGVRELIAAGERLSGLIQVDVYGELSEGMRQDDFTGDHVRYCGSLAPKDVAGVIQTYHALVLPTYYDGEGYPGVILEAYAKGVPVIATRWRSIPEIVDDGRSGLLVPPKDVAALADAMRRIATEPELAKSLRTGAAAMSVEFSSQIWTQRFIDIARTAVKRRT